MHANLTSLLPGGASALQEILNSSQVQAMALTAGINLSDPTQLTELLRRVKGKVEAATATSSPGIRASGSSSGFAGNPFYRRAVATYQSIATL